MAANASKNMFAHINDFRELEFAYEMAASPENVAHDGERSRAEVNAAYARIDKDFVARRNEITLGR